MVVAVHAMMTRGFWRRICRHLQRGCTVLRLPRQDVGMAARECSHRFIGLMPRGRRRQRGGWRGLGRYALVYQGQCRCIGARRVIGDDTLGRR